MRKHLGYACVLGAALAAALPASAEPAFVGVAVTQSAGVRKVVDDSLADRKVRGYVPAGELLQLTDRTHRENGRTWRLGRLQAGNWIWVRSDTVFSDPAALFASFGDAVGIVVRDRVVTLPSGEALTLTPSETYRVTMKDGAPALFADDGGESLEIMVGADKLPGLAQPVAVKVPTEAIKVLTREDLDAATFDGVRPFDLAGLVDTLVAKVQGKAVGSDVKNAVVTFFSTKYVTAKECRGSIATRFDAKANLDAGVSALIADFKAALSIGGSYVADVTYPEGLSFDLDTYEYGASGQKLYFEVRNEKLAANCNDDDYARRLAFNGGSAFQTELTTRALAAEGLRDDSEHYPVIGCRDEYFRLADHLKDHQVPEDLVLFLITRYARYDGRDRPAVCPATPPPG